MPNLLAVVERHGAKKTLRKVIEMYKQKKLKPEKFSIREAYEAFVGPTSNLQSGNSEFVTLQEGALDTSAFSELTGQVIFAKVQEAFELVQPISDLLTTTMSSKEEITKIVGIDGPQQPLPLNEGQDYKDSSMGQSFVQGEGAKHGRTLTITEETVFFDRTGQILLRAGMMGEGAALYRDNKVLRCVIGVDACYNPQGVSTTIWITSGAGQNSHASLPLIDALSIDSLQLLMSAQTDTSVDQNLIVVNPKILLVPMALRQKAHFIVGASGNVYSPNAAAGTPHTSTQGKLYVPDLTIIASPLVGAITPGAGAATTNWYCGDPRRQFVMIEHYPLQVMQRNMANSEGNWKRDEIASFKVRYRAGVMALDRKRWYRGLA